MEEQRTPPLSKLGATPQPSSSKLQASKQDTHTLAACTGTGFLRHSDREPSVSRADGEGPRSYRECRRPNSSHSKEFRELNKQKTADLAGARHLQHAQRQSGACPHSTPNVVRLAFTRASDSKGHPFESKEESEDSPQKRVGLIQQDLAQPNEAQHHHFLRNQVQAALQRPGLVHRRMEAGAAMCEPIECIHSGVYPETGRDPPQESISIMGTLSNDAERGDNLGSGSSTQIIQLYKTGLNIRPNTPIDIGKVHSGPVDQIDSKQLRMHARGVEAVLRARGSPNAPLSYDSGRALQRDPAANQRILAVQSEFEQMTLRGRLQLQQPCPDGLPQAPYGTHSQSTQELASREDGAGRAQICPEEQDRFAVTQSAGQNGTSLNAPINTINQQSPPSERSRPRNRAVACPSNLQSIQRQSLVPLMSQPAHIPVLTVAHSHSAATAHHSRQIQSLNNSSLVQSSQTGLRLNQRPQPSAASHLVPDMPPNTDTEYAGSTSNASPVPRLDSAMAASTDLQSMAVSQTIGALTTLAGTSLQDSQQSQQTLSGAAGLRPQNLFHRDEMFQIYLQRPPPPSPRRQRQLLGIQPLQAGEQPLFDVRQVQAASPNELSDIDADLVDEASRQAARREQEVAQGCSHRDAEASLLSSHRGSVLYIENQDQSGVSFRADSLGGARAGDGIAAQSLDPHAVLSCDRLQLQRESSSSDLSQVYHDVIESQHRSNQQTLRGLGKVAQENEALKQKMAQMERERSALEDQLAQMQQLLLEHSSVCPLLQAQRSAQGSTDGSPGQE